MRHDCYNTEVGEKVKLELNVRQWQESELKTHSKTLPPRSPMRSKCRADNRLCPFSPSTSIKPGCTDLTPLPRSRFYEEAGSNVSHTNVSRTSQKTNDQLKQALDFKRRKPGMDILENSGTSTFEEEIVLCFGSIHLSEETDFLSPLIQYDNPLYEEESPSISKELDFLGENMTLVLLYLAVLNTATRKELLQFKQIGPKRAAKILELQQNCEEPFQDFQDLNSIGVNDKQPLSLFNRRVIEDYFS